jgi:hypothetical protein
MLGLFEEVAAEAFCACGADNADGREHRQLFFRFG